MADKNGTEKASNGKLNPLFLLGAVALVSMALALAAITHFVPSGQFCETTHVTGPDPSETERTDESSSAHGAQVGPDVTTTNRIAESSRSTEITRTCRGMTAGELAPLLIPAVLLLLPYIKSFNIAGLGVELRDLQKAVDNTKKDIGYVRDALRVMQVQLVQQTQTVQQALSVNPQINFIVAEPIARGAVEAQEEEIVSVDELLEDEE